MRLLLATVLAAANVRLNLQLTGIIALIAGVIILFRPKVLNFVVAIYLILIGLIGIFHVRA